MQVDELIDRLDYRDNPNYIRGDDLGRAPDYAHIFRRAQSRMELRGVYVLQQPHSKETHRNALVPVVYVCEAKDEKEANEFRRLTWNQNAAPFLIIKTAAKIRLFSTFNYPRAGGWIATGRTPEAVLDRRIEFREIASVLHAFTSQSIDDGTIWREYGQFVTPKGRVDWSLLESLKRLDELLIGSGLEWRTSHALIGKYVYLWYLRQRDILSNRRLGAWKIDPNDVFTRYATLTAFKCVLEELENWLNGSVFPLDWERVSAPKQEHLRKVAGVFAGDTPDGQLHLAFDAYDFSIIPVETLSAIYEQFLHAHEPKKEKPRGKELGAYYTPVPVVNFMLEELNDRRPLKEGMTCFDASCGSGAFLVQCYRRLIENRIRKDGKVIRRPAELRDDLLVKHIFGVDRDGDACRVTELSLILTLLDYVDPPDLSPVHNFKLPDLHNKNIFEADFFDPRSTWAESSRSRRYDWVVGNPPWVELEPPKKDEQEDAKDKDQPARDWINDPANKREMPIGGNQLAEAFLWKVVPHLQAGGVAAMLVPAMTLFKEESASFRQRFFGSQAVWCVANFANLAYVLFAGRAETPAAAFFYSPNVEEERPEPDQTILCYSPLVATQEANRPGRAGTKKDTWNIVVNGSEIREVTVAEAASGNPLVWKTAMWGSHLDTTLLRSIEGRFKRLQAVRETLGLEMNQGVELRTTGVYVDELVDKNTIDSGSLRGCGRIYSFPNDSLYKITREYAHLRKGRDDLPLRVSRPPHVIVDAARCFAVYSDSFIAVPARDVGIAGGPSDMLKMISLYLMSDFALYHQFLTSPQMGIYKSIADLNTLKQLPFPLEEIMRGGLARWSKLHSALVAASVRAKAKPTKATSTPSLFDEDEPDDDIGRLERQLNEMVNDALGLRPSDRWLISDLVHVRMTLTKGKVDPFAVDSPSPEEDMRPYCEVLKEELDSLIEVATDDRHLVDVIHEKDSAMIVVHRAPARPLHESIRILPANSEEAQSLRQIRQDLLRRHSQWLYFERALRRYKTETNTVYLFKPMQRLHWLRSQALIDAGEVIADTAGGGGG
jgi:hypothetical protein